MRSAPPPLAPQFPPGHRGRAGEGPQRAGPRAAPSRTCFRWVRGLRDGTPRFVPWLLTQKDGIGRLRCRAAKATRLAIGRAVSGRTAPRVAASQVLGAPRARIFLPFSRIPPGRLRLRRRRLLQTPPGPAPPGFWVCLCPVKTAPGRHAPRPGPAGAGVRFQARAVSSSCCDSSCDKSRPARGPGGVGSLVCPAGLRPPWADNVAQEGFGGDGFGGGEANYARGGMDGASLRGLRARRAAPPN